MMSLPYETNPKFEDEHAVCCCDKQVVPTHGTTFVKTEMGFLMEKDRFWCKRCGLTLTFAQMDTYGETWEQITARQKKLDDARIAKEKAIKAQEALEDPLA